MWNSTFLNDTKVSFFLNYIHVFPSFFDHTVKLLIYFSLTVTWTVTLYALVLLMVFF